MKKLGESFEFTASDLVGYLNCQHLSELDRAVAEGFRKKPGITAPLLEFLELLRERGAAHERDYVQHLKDKGLDVLQIDGVDVSKKAVSQTLGAIRRGTHVIVQGALSHDGWIGRADILYRIETKNSFGNWSYEVIDTKLARETKAGTVIQLCVYSDLLHAAQDIAPEKMYVVAPYSNYQPQIFRYADYAAYFRKLKRGLNDHLAQQPPQDTYPDPKLHCDICRWHSICDQRRRDDDHLCLVAGISRSQINELKQHGIESVKQLSEASLPLEWKPDRGSAKAYERVIKQARIQIKGRESNQPEYELLPVEEGFGLTCLPVPDAGDIFLDLEGDPFVGEHGLEYLFGYLYTDNRQIEYRELWAFSRAEEKTAFEAFVDFVMDRWKTFPDLHIYHYAPYEPAALKRLMGRYATREEEIDQMLRAGLFVDLYRVVRQGVRASVESYSIKKLEPFYKFERKTPLQDANKALRSFEAAIELGILPDTDLAEIKKIVGLYNQDDCASASALRDWLETLRDQLIKNGIQISRPVPIKPAPNQALSKRQIELRNIIESLTANISPDPEQRTTEEQARWILANILDWHRREDKAVWWEYFRLAELSTEDLLDERAAVSELTFQKRVGGTDKAPIHRYGFPPQETDIRGGEELRAPGGKLFGKAESISLESSTIDIKKRQDTASIDPDAVFGYTHIDKSVLADALMRIGDYVAEHGIKHDRQYHAARALLLKQMPQLNDEPIRKAGESTLDAALRLTKHLGDGIFPIQGPPGAGKTYTAARMICEFVKQGKTIGITANSHKVIRHVLDETIKVARGQAIDLKCCHKTADTESGDDCLSFTKDNKKILSDLKSKNVQVGGGTAWLWAREDAANAVDILIVDEAAQMSLADVLAISHAAKTLILIGDPNQLDQPMQGSHPDGTDVSALDYILDGAQTIAPEKGLFLEETWRLHPKICDFTSELFYAGKLRARSGLENQIIKGSGLIDGAGIRYLPVQHTGNRNRSPEEAQAIYDLVTRVLASGTTWTDRNGKEHRICLDDILIITPYNAQVFEILKKLPEARVGTVDKFQGQEAPISIYSIATSSQADAPRGMEFLYSPNRLNVATSRAKCLTILVGSPQIFEAECQTPRQMQLANAFCRYAESAQNIFLP